MGRNKKEPTKVIRIPLKHEDKVKKFVLDLEARPIRNEQGKIKTFHKMPKTKNT